MGGGRRRPRSAPTWPGFLLLAPLIGWSPLVGASELLRTAYEVTWNGIQIGAFETEVVRESGRYRVSYQARTTGLIGWLFPFSSSGRSDGLRNSSGLRPTTFQGESQWSEGSSSWTVAFDADGRATDIAVSSPYLADREPVPAALQVGPDPLALALEAIEAAAAGVRLAGTSFDGRRAIRLDLACDRQKIHMAGTDERVDADLVCLIDGRLVAGASRRWRDRTPSEQQREPTRVWLERGILKDGYWPVRIETESRYGMVGVELIDLDG